MRLIEAAAAQLRALCSATGYAGRSDEMIAWLGRLGSSWGDRTVDDPPLWSGITDDCSPIEYSLKIGRGGPELRFLVESIDPEPSPGRYFARGLGVLDAIERQGVDTSPVRRVVDLFTPEVEDVYFTMFHAVVFWPSGEPMLKTYLNPAAKGRAKDRSLMREALERFGVVSAFDTVCRHIGERDEIQFLCLDLGPQAGSRIKVYVRHRTRSMEPVEAALACSKAYAPGEATRFVQAVTGWDPNALRRPPITMFNLGRDDAPSRAALHLPTFPFGGHDAGVAYRAALWLEAHGLDAEPLARAVEALAGVSLDRSLGVFNYLSMQGSGDDLQMTAYLCPRFYQSRHGPIGYDPARAWPTPVQAAGFSEWWTQVQRLVGGS
jgi:DMATS type aromatic prenyltransferase